VKRNIVIKILSVLLILSVFANISSCTNKADSAVLKYTKNEGKTYTYMSKNLFSLWMSIQKSIYSYLAADDSAWDKSYTTAEKSISLSDLVKNEAVDSAKSLIVGVYLFDNVYHLKLTNDQKDAVSKQVSDLVKQHNFKTKSEFDEFLSTFGADEATLKEYFTFVSKYDLLYKYLSGEGRKIKVTADEEKDYFEKNYAIVNHIFLNTGTKTKSDGTSIEMTEEERASQKVLADEIMKKINAGEDFNTLQVQYTEDAYGVSMYPKGFFVTADGTYPSEFQTASLEMKDNEIRKVESTSNKKSVGIHIIKKLPMNKELYNTYEDIEGNIKPAIISKKFNDFIAKYTDKVAIDEKTTSIFDMKKIIAFS